MKNIYTTIAINVLNVIVLLLLANVVLGLIFFVKDNQKEKTNEKILQQLSASSPFTYFDSLGAPIYAGDLNTYIRKEFDFRSFEHADEKATLEMLIEANELTRMGFDYQELGAYAEPIFHGQYIGIITDSVGIPHRKVIGPKNEKGLPVKKIFLFGGSTTMGMHVADVDTYASFLANKLNATSSEFFYQVHNYGHIGHTPTQEVMLLYDLIRMGNQPDLAIFMDGLNKGSGSDISLFGRSFAELVVDNRQPKNFKWNEYFQNSKLPIIRLARSIQKRFQKENGAKNLEPDTDLAGFEQIEKASQLTLNRFLENYAFTDFLKERYGVEILLFSQPDVSTHYNLALLKNDYPEYRNVRNTIIEKFYQPLWLKRPDMIRLDHLFEAFGSSRKAIIDDCHYSPEFNAFIAEALVPYIFLAIKNSNPSTEVFLPTGRNRELSKVQSEVTE